MLKGALNKYHPVQHAKDALSLSKILNKTTATPQQNPNYAQAMDRLARPPTALLTHFASLLTKHGRRNDSLLLRVSTALRLKYAHANPVEQAVDALKPTIRYYKPKDRKVWVPEAVWPKSALSMAMRWIIRAASARTYGQFKQPDLERGLLDELDAVLSGTSSLYAKKLQCHKNPN